MATLPAEELQGIYDCAINGVGYLIDWIQPDRIAYDQQGDDLLVERRDTSEEMTENKLDRLWWRSQRSQHGGMGQRRFDVPRVSDPNAFFDSKGIDVLAVPGESALLRDVVKREAVTDSPSAHRFVVTDEFLWLAVDSGDIRRCGFNTLTDTWTMNQQSTLAGEAIGTERIWDVTADGRVVYVALGTLGIHRRLLPANVQDDACDATTGWVAVGSVVAVTTSTKMEGTGAIAWSSISNGDTVTKTFGAPVDFSSAASILFWLRSSAAVAVGGLEIRFIDSVGNYFYVRPSLAATTWTEFSYARSQFTTVGAPNWNSIDSIEFRSLFGSNYSMQIDDIRHVADGSYTHWSDKICRFLRFAGRTFYGAGPSAAGSTQWKIFEAGTGATSVNLTPDPPDGFEVTAIAELSGKIYFALKKGNRGHILVYDGTSLTVATELPVGDVPLSLTAYAGTLLMVGARRVDNANADKGLGVWYRGERSSTGDLELTKICVIGENDSGLDYGIQTAFELGEHVHFGWSAGANNTRLARASALQAQVTPQVSDNSANPFAGLGIYSPATNAYARHISAGVVSGLVVASGVFAGRRVFAIDGDGLYVEDTDLVSTGYIISSIIDWNIDGPKVLVQAQVGTKPLPAGSSVVLDYSIDEGATWIAVIPAGDSATADVEETKAINAIVRAVQYRVTYNRATDTTVGPVLKKAGLAAIYADKPRFVHQIWIQAYDRMQLRNGVPHPDEGEPSLAHNIYSTLSALRTASTPVDYQPPGYGVAHTDVLKVRVASLRRVRRWVPDSGFTDLLAVTLVELAS